MTESLREAFNLVFNAGCSFIAGVLIAYLSVRLFRIPLGRWKLYVLALPFIKMLYDLSRGIPKGSYVFLHGALSPFRAAPKQQTLEITAGFDTLTPTLKFAFNIKGAGDEKFSISMADYLYEALQLKVAPWAPQALLAAVIAVSAALLLLRVRAALSFERERRRDRLSSATLTLPEQKIGFREVDVYISESQDGTPFTGGLLRPYVCFPKRTWERFSAEERDAVLKHELAHVRSFDCAINGVIAFLGDVFWFVPGYRWLKARIDRLREQVADQGAVQQGASPIHLASALVTMAESRLEPRPAIYSALVREGSLLKGRVRHLLGQEAESVKPPRWLWRNPFGRALVLFWTTTVVLACTVAGNHEPTQFPDWIEQLYKAWGWM